jgi:hypothetical protein
MSQTSETIYVRECPDKLRVIEKPEGLKCIEEIVLALKSDQVALVRNVVTEMADNLIREVANRFALDDNLELQAGFASFHGHRKNIGKYFMTVNDRSDYQFIPPHSEGSSFSAMQLAAFYCFENSTDGGESILMNVGQTEDCWKMLKEVAYRLRLDSGELAQHEIARIRALYHLNYPSDALAGEDEILKEEQTEIPGVTLLTVLAKPQKTYSYLLGTNVFALWDSIASVDFDVADQFASLLREEKLLREPAEGLEIAAMDNTAHRHLRHSGIRYSSLFTCKITHKSHPGELLIQNNLTWTHAAANWSPGLGIRRVAASFA